MAATPPPLNPASRAPGAGSDSGRFVEYDRFIDSTLRRTRRQVRNVDIAGGLMLLGAGTLLFLLLMALLDHWVVPGGLGTGSRWLALFAFLAGAGVFCWRTLFPLFWRRINPVYAAHSIERSKPNLKNSLINFLLLRANPAGLPQNVFQAIEEQAATNLAKVPAEAVIDRSKLIRIGYLLLAVLACAAVYKVVSPKDPLRSFARVALPWVDIDRPTRVKILSVDPGNCTVVQGSRLLVKAELQGLAADQPVTLIYSTADGQAVDQTIAMAVPADGYFWQAQLPAGSEGIQQDITYRVIAGDATSHPFRLKVDAAPTILVQKVEYKYPTYAGLERRSVEREADIKGLEGTEVTITAEANQPIKQAHIDFDCDGSANQRMQVDEKDNPRRATVTFTLGLRDDRKTPEHGSYQLLFTNPAGQENQQPIRHEIEVTPDLPPEIQILEPVKELVEVPLDGELNVEIVANDPDYGLERVVLVGLLDNRPLATQKLLDETHRGQFTRKLTLAPRKLGLKQGEILDYFAWAEDARLAAPNHVETPHRRLKVVSPTNRPKQDQLAQNDRPDRRQREGQQGGGAQDPQQQDAGNADQQRGAGEEHRAGDGNQANQQQQGTEGQAGEPQPGQAGGGKPEDGQGKSEAGQGKSEGGKPESGQGEAGGDQQGQGAADKGNESGAKSGDQPSGQGQKPQPSGGDQSNKGGQPQAGGGQGGQEGGEKSGQKDGQAGGQAGGKEQKPGDGQQGKGQQGSKGQQGGKGQQPADQPVAKDGSQDGEAFDRILDRMREKEPGKLKEQEEQSQNAGGKPSGDDNKQTQGDKQGGGKPQGANSGEKPSDPADGQGPKGKKFEKGQGGKDSGEKAPDGTQGSGGESRPGGSGNGEGETNEPGKPTGEAGGKPGGEPTRGGDKPAPKDGGQNSQPAPAGTKPEAGDGQAAAGQRGQKPNDKPSNSTEDTGENTREDAQAQDRSGEGGASKGPTQQSGAKPADPQQTPGAKGGDPAQDKGKSGAAGQGTRDKNGSPPAQGNNQQREKSPDGDGKSAQPPGDEAPSPSNSNRQSNSKGSQAGDRSGGGGQGGGQGASRSGTGNTGTNAAADEGANTADERGDGDVADRAGQDKEAAGKTGQGGTKPGEGSNSRESASAKADPGGQRNQAGGKTGKATPQDGSQPQGAQPGEEGGNNQGAPQGTGHNESKDAQPTPSEVEKADDANLEFSRRATELAIQRLRDQLNKGQVDQELLDRLQWDKDDLDQMVRRYEEMYRKANANGPQAQRAKAELDSTLRGLGLHPRGTQIKNGHADDQTHGLKEGRRTRPPVEYAEQFRAYTQGTSRARGAASDTPAPPAPTNK